MTKLDIIGGIPQPTGGVTNFVYRLALHFAPRVGTIFDLYPAQQKISVPGTAHSIVPSGFLNRVFWLIGASKHWRHLYVNFSSERALWAFLVLPKRKGSTWLLTLHHGNLAIGANATSAISGFAYTAALRKFDRIGYLSQDQFKRFTEAHVPAGRLYPISSYLPPPPPTAPRQRIANHILASGMGTAIYRHEWVADYVASNPGVTATFCIYGEGATESIRTRLVSAAPDRIVVRLNLSSEEFQNELTGASIYVRPTAADSLGVAVYEALALGLRVVASDACARPAAAAVFPAHDKAAFAFAVDRARTTASEFHLPSNAAPAAHSNVDDIALFLFGTRQ